MKAPIEERAYEVKLYIGSREGYHGPSFNRQALAAAIAEFQNSNDRKQMVSLRLTPCLFLVGDWQEDGHEVTSINYPRFPKRPYDLQVFMIDLAKFLLYRLKQNRITVMSPEWTRTFESESNNTE